MLSPGGWFHNITNKSPAVTLWLKISCFQWMITIYKHHTSLFFLAPLPIDPFLKQTQSPTVKPPTTCLHPPNPALWSGPIRILAEGLIMQAAVSPLRWGPPGDSSTASDWGSATEPDSSTNNTEKRMLMDQIRWVLRWEEGVQRRWWAGWQALLISRHSDEALCAMACICCACLSEKHWPPRIMPPVTDMFSLHIALKFERWRKRVNRGREALAKAIDGWLCEAICSTVLCSFLLPSNMPFPSSIYPT